MSSNKILKLAGVLKSKQIKTYKSASNYCKEVKSYNKLPTRYIYLSLELSKFIYK